MGADLKFKLTILDQIEHDLIGIKYVLSTKRSEV